jgi:trimethylamine--corrinoid protein Co-methyltransferase
VDGIPVNEQTLALDATERVATGGPGCIFLTDDHTFDYFRQAMFLPSLLNRSRHDAWVSEGANDLYRRCNTEARRILTEHQVEPKPEEVLSQVEHILGARD